LPSTRPYRARYGDDFNGEDVVLVSDRFEERLTAVEQRLDLEARLRAAVDGDQAELKEGLRGANRLLRALARTQDEHTVRLNKQLAAIGAQTEALASFNVTLTSVTERLGEHSRILISLDGRVGEVEGRMSGMENRMSGVEGHVVDMGGKLDRVLAVLERPESGD
jgi:hypothetical protein